MRKLVVYLARNSIMERFGLYSMAKKITITAIACLLSVFLVFAMVKYSRNVLQHTKQDAMSSSQTENTTGIVSTNTSTTISNNITTPESKPQATESIPSQETAMPQKNENTVTPALPPVTPSQPVTQELPQWKQMYISQATVWRTKYDHFALVYIDGDDIPELYMYGNNQSELCAYRSDAVNPQKKVLISQRMNGMGGGNYHKKSGKFLNVCAEGEYLAIYVYELTDIFRQTFYGREDQSANAPVYYIGNYAGAVSEDEFKNTVNQYIDTTKTEFLHQNALTLDAFVEYVTNFQV